MRISRIFRIISIVLATVPICLLLLFNVILKGSSETSYSTNFILFSVIEIINIVFVIIIFKSKDNIRKPVLVIFIAYAIITFLVPVFRVQHAYKLTGLKSDIPGIAVDYEYRDIYGVDISGLVSLYQSYF